MVQICCIEARSGKGLQHRSIGGQGRIGPGQLANLGVSQHFGAVATYQLPQRMLGLALPIALHVTLS